MAPDRRLSALNMKDDRHLADLRGGQRADDERALALQHAPWLRMDAREPFLPLALGYTVFREDGDSPSFPRRISLPPGSDCAIEYAIWWDWDIEHLYELEHIWVYLDAAGRVMAADASWHGEWHAMQTADAPLSLLAGRVALYSEPGKHAFSATRQRLLERRQKTALGCGPRAGIGGVHVTPLFAGRIRERNVLDKQLVWTWLERRRFTPSWDFTQLVDLRDRIAVPWEALEAWIPERVTQVLAGLEADISPPQRRVLRIAHRGASAIAQENSLSAFRVAAARGADMLEVDLRFTADKVPVAAHDADLRRVYGVAGNIADCSLAELQQLTAGRGEPLLTLEEVAQSCRELMLGLYLDVKDVADEDAAGEAVATLRRHGLLEVTVFGSFRADWMAELKALFPQALTSILFASVHVEPVQLARSLRADFVHACWERLERPQDHLTPQWLDAVRAAGLGVMIWNEHRPEVIHDLHQLGIYGICADDPALLLPPQGQ